MANKDYKKSPCGNMSSTDKILNGVENEGVNMLGNINLPPNNNYTDFRDKKQEARNKNKPENKEHDTEAYKRIEASAINIISSFGITGRNKQLRVIKQLESAAGIKLPASAVSQLQAKLKTVYIKDEEKFITYDYVIEKIRAVPTIDYCGTVARYNAEKGVYVKVEDKDLKKEFMFASDVPSKNKNSYNSNEYMKQYHLLAVAQEAEYNKDYINCKNGVYSIKTGELLKHDPKYRTVLQVNADYGCTGKEQFENSVFKKQLLDGLFDDKTQLLVQEMFALLISPHAKEVHKAFILHGSGSNGKSVLASIIIALLGENNRAEISINDFDRTNGRFELCNIADKHYALDTDTQECNGVGTMFKKAVSGETITIEKKGENKINMNLNMTYVFALNKLPKGNGDKSYGFYRRTCVIPMYKTYGTEEEIKAGKAQFLEDKTLESKIISNELNIVFTWAMEGLKRLMANNWKLTESEAVEQANEEFRKTTDSIYDFFKHYKFVEGSKSDKILKKELYEKYKEFMEDTREGQTARTQTTFFVEIKKYLPKNVSYKMQTVRIGGKRSQAYVGLTLAEIEDLEGNEVN